MKTIFKYKIETTDEQTISMPQGAEILTVQIQNGDPHIWVLVDMTQDDVIRTIEVFGTGNPIRDPNAPRRYVGTYQLRDGRLIFHVFEKL
jgi:hypothetical protein